MQKYHYFDNITLCLLEISLLSIIVYSIIKLVARYVLRIFSTKQKISCEVKINRGKYSQGCYAACFAATSTFYALAVKEAAVLEGYRLSIYLANQIMLAYVFYWNADYRNLVNYCYKKYNERYE